MIEAIIFDYFGVISSDDYWTFVGADKNDAVANKEFVQLTNRVNLGSLHWMEFINYVSQKTGKTVEDVIAMYQAEGINPQVLALVRSCKANYLTAVLTNAHHEYVEPLFVEAGFYNIFDKIIISSRVGVVKPDKRIFEFTLQQLAITAHQALFIDDIERNVEGARAIGMTGIVYKDVNQLRQELNKLGIEFDYNSHT